MEVLMCTKCGIEKRAECFYWVKGKESGRRRSSCIQCFSKEVKARRKSQYQARKKEHSSMLAKSPGKTKCCSICSESKALDAFVFHSSKKDLLSSECRKCRLKLAKKRMGSNQALFEDSDRTATKACKVCGVDKQLLEFNRHLGNKDLHRSECIECQGAASRSRWEKNKGSNNTKRRLWYKDNQEVVYGWGIKKKFGITYEDYLEMLQKQDGRCSICGIDTPGDKHKHFAVDHDHKTGKVRSLLCSRCNCGIGHLNDDPVLIRKAAEYIEQHST
jgi:hypothetical protein